MVRRFKSRATAGRVLKLGTLGALCSLADIKLNVNRGDGGLGTLIAGVPPSTPTMTLADNGNGTGAVATIAGADAGTTNTVYWAHWRGPYTWTSGGSRSGNGTVSLSITSLGTKWAHVKSVDSLGQASVSSIVEFEVSSTSNNGPIRMAEEALRTTLADCATFRTLTGTADRAAAAARIHYEGLPPPFEPHKGFALAELDEYRPFAIVFYEHQAGYAASRRGLDTWTEAGGLYIRIERATPHSEQGDLAESDRTWTRLVGKIVSELATLCGGSNSYEYLDARAIELVDLWRVADEEKATDGDYQAAVVRVQWGVGR